MTSELSSWDPIWEQIFRAQEWGKYPPEHVIRFVARSFYGVPDRRSVKLLDVGSGPGACTWYMAREGFSVSAIDGSPAAIDRLSKRLTAEGLAAEAKVGDIGQLPWADASFHGVIDNAAVCCNPFANARRIVGEIARVLKPGGWVCSASFTDRTWGMARERRSSGAAFVTSRKGRLRAAVSRCSSDGSSSTSCSSSSRRRPWTGWPGPWARTG